MSTGGKIPVIELFGPTIQGEGLLLGTPTHFLRLGGCGYRCSWCDSMHAVLPDEVEKNRTLMTQEEIFSRIYLLPKAPYITLTGGDPCIHKDLYTLMRLLRANSYRVAVETQGEFFPDWLHLADVVTFSPKGPTSGMNTNIHQFREDLLRFRNLSQSQICVKVVVFDNADLEYALQLYEAVKPQHYRPLYQQFTFQVGSPTTAQTLDELKYAYERVGTPEEDRKYDVTHIKRETILERYEWLVDRLLKGSVELDHMTTITPQQHVLLWPTQDKGR